MDVRKSEVGIGQTGRKGKLAASRRTREKKKVPETDKKNLIVPYTG